MRPQTSYLICATHRTGSTLLCEALANTGLAGQPAEYFWSGYEPLWSARWGSTTYAEYHAAALERTTTPNGVFGCKIIFAYFDDFLSKVRQLHGYADLSTPVLLSTIFPNLHYIWITRRDKVRQAVSLWKAVQSQIWEQRTEQPTAPVQNPVFDFEAIDNWLQAILQHEAAWQHYFAEWGVTPFTVVYENFIKAYEATVLDILYYLHIPAPDGLVFGKRALRKQANALSEEWVQRYHHIREGDVSRANCQGEEG